jgi:hypothetical protein
MLSHRAARVAFAALLVFALASPRAHARDFRRPTMVPPLQNVNLEEEEERMDEESRQLAATVALYLPLALGVLAMPGAMPAPILRTPVVPQSEPPILHAHYR